MSDLDHDIMISDSSCDHEIYERIKALEKFDVDKIKQSVRQLLDYSKKYSSESTIFLNKLMKSKVVTQEFSTTLL